MSNSNIQRNVIEDRMISLLVDHVLEEGAGKGLMRGLTEDTAQQLEQIDSLTMIHLKKQMRGKAIKFTIDFNQKEFITALHRSMTKAKTQKLERRAISLGASKKDMLIYATMSSHKFSEIRKQTLNRQTRARPKALDNSERDKLNQCYIKHSSLRSGETGLKELVKLSEESGIDINRITTYWLES